MNRRVSHVILAASALMLVACGGKKGVTNPPPTTARIVVSAGSPNLSVAQSATGSSTITVARTSFTGDVALTAENLPTGVTAAFTPASLTAGATSSSLALVASGTAATGASTVTVRARGTGVSDATTTVALTVTAAVSGTVAIALNPTTASITAGQTATTVATITRGGGFAGGVNFTVTGAPAGMTTTLSSSNPVTAGTVTLSAATLASVTPGPYTLTVRANATGLAEATATYVVTVAAPPSNNVTWRFCDPTRLPLWFAYQDGTTGTWQRVSETSPGVYTFGYGQPVIGIATVSTEQSRTVTDVTYYGLSEIATAAAAECTDNPVPGTKSLTGTISGFTSATQIGLVSIGAALSSSTNQSTPSFTITKVPNGAVDLIAIRSDLVSSSVLRVLLLRAQNPADGASLGTLDLAGGTSFAPVSDTLTITAPNDGALLGTNVFTTNTGSSAAFTMPTLSSGVATQYQGVPESQMAAGELQQVQVAQSVGTTLSRFITRFTRGPSRVALTMPGDPGAPMITSVSGAYPRATATGSLPAAFNNLITVSFNQTARNRLWAMSATAAGRTSTTSYSFTLPDFSAVPGWQATWALGSGSSDVTSTFFGQTGADANGAPIAGTTIYTIGRLGSYTFP